MSTSLYIHDVEKITKSGIDHNEETDTYTMRLFITDTDGHYFDLVLFSKELKNLELVK